MSCRTTKAISIRNWSLIYSFYRNNLFFIFLFVLDRRGEFGVDLRNAAIH